MTITQGLGLQRSSKSKDRDRVMMLNKAVMVLMILNNLFPSIIRAMMTNKMVVLLAIVQMTLGYPAYLSGYVRRNQELVFYCQ